MVRSTVVVVVNHGLARRARMGFQEAVDAGCQAQKRLTQEPQQLSQQLVGRWLVGLVFFNKGEDRRRRRG